MRTETQTLNAAHLVLVSSSNIEENSRAANAEGLKSTTIETCVTGRRSSLLCLCLCVDDVCLCACDEGVEWDVHVSTVSRSQL